MRDDRIGGMAAAGNGDSGEARERGWAREWEGGGEGKETSDVPVAGRALL